MAMKKIWVAGIFVSAFLLLLQCEEAHAAEFVVGDDQGWGPETNVSRWLEGKSFKAGDVLIFRYTCPYCSFVTVISDYYYRLCDAYSDLKKFYNSGNDRVILDYGDNFFVPSYHEYCEKLKFKLWVERGQQQGLGRSSGAGVTEWQDDDAAEGSGRQRGGGTIWVWFMAEQRAGQKQQRWRVVVEQQR
ncbi:chemocyanin-like [Pyrus communis]|uniref:chemocyanin-like n=1 Tax=Pyrus communis TaxID=23211 RepID=UPI0035C200B3